MKICYLANAASIHTVRWINYFANHDWDVELITWHPPSSNSEIHPDVVVHRILFPPHYIARYGALLEISRLIKKIHPDIIHAHYISHFGILAGLYSCLSGFKPTVLTAWGDDVLTDPKGFKKLLVKYALKKADCITCDGENSKYVMVNLGANFQKIRIIFHGVDVQKFKSTQKSEKLSEDLEIFDSPVIISLRNLKPLYDVESLILAIPRVLKKVPEVKFVIVGKGSQEAYLRRLTKSLEVDGNVKFVGQIPHDELPKYLASSDVYVSTSLSDGGISVSTLEAMACELAPVVTDVGDNKRWIKDGKNGFIIPIKDTKALAERITYLLKNKDIRKEFGNINRKIIEERNNYYKEMEKMESIYIELIERYKS